MRIVYDTAGLAPFAGCVFVPTMGALHEGHFTLVREAAKLASTLPARTPVVVSVFVNPTQFNDPGDLDRYPRTLEADARGCAAAGADAVFAPPVDVIYPPGEPAPAPSLPDVATRPGLEDARRPGHFAGVCQVVSRLFALVRPSAALFGEKDWQQLQVITAMVREGALPVRIIPVPTVREPDGLAMSSRNVFLTPAERPRAAALWKALRAAGAQPTPAAAETAMAATLTAAGLEIEYAVVRDAATLLPVTSASPAAPARALIAVRLGAVRLIDNAPWPM
jgi:pantoate--beta-alanine ligase